LARPHLDELECLAFSGTLFVTDRKTGTLTIAIRHHMSARLKFYMAVTGVLSLLCAAANIFNLIPVKMEMGFNLLRIMSFAGFIGSLVTWNQSRHQKQS
jgi:hypothetical protein